MHTISQMHVCTNKQPPSNPSTPPLLSFSSSPPNRHLAWHMPRSQGSQLSNRCQCMRYNTRGSPITTQMFCFSYSTSCLLFPSIPSVQGPLRMAQNLPCTNPPSQFTLTEVHPSIHRHTRIQPVVSQMKSMWLSINRVEKGWEWDVCTYCTVCVGGGWWAAGGDIATRPWIRTKDSSHWSDMSYFAAFLNQTPVHTHTGMLACIHVQKHAYINKRKCTKGNRLDLLSM